MNLRNVDPEWTIDDLLAEDGIFFLKDIVGLLGVPGLKIKKHAKALTKEGKNAYALMGARKVWNHWIVRMTTFAPYFVVNLKPLTSPVKEEWDGNTLLKQKGIYLLTDVCEKLPFTTHQLRYQAKKLSDPKKEIGIWKDEDLSVFVVDMSVFSKWVMKLWE